LFESSFAVASIDVSSDRDGMKRQPPVIRGAPQYDRRRKGDDAALTLNISRVRAFLIGAAIAVVALAAVGTTLSPAAAPATPRNDNYLDSLDLNIRPHAALNSVATLEDRENAAAATVQSNVFSGCGQSTCPTGPAEVTTCKGVSYGNTIWYDFHPQSPGSVRIRTSGYDNVIALYTYNVSTLVPTELQCTHISDFPSEELDASVKKGVNYTFQIGAVNGMGGPMDMLFDYFIAPPKRLTAQVSLTASATATAVTVLSLVVQTSRGTTIQVNCGDFCGPQQARIGKFSPTTVKFPKLGGTKMPVGAKLQVRVSAPNSIGTLIQYTVVPHNVVKQTFCMEPGKRTPRKTCH
jgi:hypothetical protein